MITSQKARYAVRAVLELSKRNGSGPVKAAEIARVQQIPVRFLESILWELWLAGVVKSVRGKDGGYLLAKPPAEVTMGELIRVIQGPAYAADCLDPAKSGECALRSTIRSDGLEALRSGYPSGSRGDRRTRRCSRGRAAPR